MVVPRLRRIAYAVLVLLTPTDRTYKQLLLISLILLNMYVIYVDILRLYRSLIDGLVPETPDRYN